MMRGSASRAFGGTLQARQCVGRAGDEQLAERRLDEPAPPPWREAERSVERDAACVGIDRRDLDEFIVRDAERQANVKREAMRSHGVLREENDFDGADPPSDAGDVGNQGIQPRDSFDRSFRSAYPSPHPPSRFSTKAGLCAKGQLGCHA